MSIVAIDKTSVHRITSGQVVIDLQTAVKELVENSLDAGATNLEVRFKNYGMATIEVVDNGGGIPEENYEALALKHHTSKLSSLADLETVTTFGFRGEALSSLCALCESVVVSTATQPPMGVTLELESSGKIRHKGKVARQRGTTVTLTHLFSPLPVRRKDFERHAKREYGKVLSLLHAYAVGPCARSSVRLTVSNQMDKGQKSVQIRTPGTSSQRDAVSSLWNPKMLGNVVDLHVSFAVERDKTALKRTPDANTAPIQMTVRGLVSKFAVGCGRTGPDLQFFYVNGRPCTLSKIQKAFNEVYRSFNATQSPFVIADLNLPTDAYDVNVSPDKRTIFIHHEASLIESLKAALESAFAPTRSTFDLASRSGNMTQSTLHATSKRTSSSVAQRPAVDVEEESFDEAAAKAVDEAVDVEMQTVAVGEARKQLKQGATGDLQSVEIASAPVATLARTNTSAAPALGNEGTQSAEDLDQSETSPFLVPVATLAPISASVSAATSAVARRSATPPPVPVGRKRSRRGTSEDEVNSNTDADAVVALDASQTVWARRLKRADEGERAASPERDAPRKKQRSEAAHVGDPEPTIASGPRRQRQPASETDDIEEMEMEVNNLNGQTTGTRRGSANKSAMPSHRDVGGKGKGRADDRTQADSSPAQGASQTQFKIKPLRRGIRSILIGYSRPGSQPSSMLGTDEDELESSGEEEEQSDGVSATVRQDADTGSMEVDESEHTFDDQTFLVQADRGASSNDRRGDEEDQESVVIQGLRKPPGSVGGSSAVIDLTDEDMFDSSELSLGTLAMEGSTSSVSCNDKDDLESESHEVIRTIDGSGDLTLRLEVTDIAAVWRTLPRHQGAAAADKAVPRDDAAAELLRDASLASGGSDDAATDALARTINKTDFETMEIVGQFNLGFIVARRRVAAATEGAGPGDGALALTMDDLFIVDQHAADEKYNFETLQQTTQIQSQKLFRPQPLELTASDELLALENIDVLRRNGFEVVTGTETETETAPRLALTAQPVSKDTVFDMKDLEELIHRMRDAPAGTTPRCAKARAMFAMRACRKSVMVGMPLTLGQMTSVVRHMGTMDQPWNCPHGRPTMRHLADITGPRERMRKVDWAAFG